MKFVDTHCHVDRYPDPLMVLEHAEAAGVVTVAVTEVPSQVKRLALRLGKRKLVRVAVGLHPLRAATASPMDLALFNQLLDGTEYVGEVGLDGSREGQATFSKQAKVFAHILEQPRVQNKILTVHSRGAEARTIEMLSDAGVTAILHWYSGPQKHIESALQAGLWFSINPAMLRSENGQRIIAALPRERIVTETDGPHSRVGRRASEPRDIPDVVKGLARVWSVSPAEARARVFDNMSTIAAAAGAR